MADGNREYGGIVIVQQESSFYGSSAVFGRQTIGVAAAEVKVGAAKLSGRHSLSIQADPDNGDAIYIGLDNTVTTIKWAWKLPAGQGIKIMLNPDANLSIYAISGSANQYIGIVEG